MNPQLLGTIRHILTLLGGFLVAMGVVSEEAIMGVSDAVFQIIGGVITIIAFVASWKAPEKKK
jgi:hypothetical protein